jgi:hypothetical protein|tara:strand:+ start:153 stop:368 length:216 start_codon:yes stop_codon:yes gene_type:complete
MRFSYNIEGPALRGKCCPDELSCERTDWETNPWPPFILERVFHLRRAVNAKILCDKWDCCKLVMRRFDTNG